MDTTPTIDTEMLQKRYDQLLAEVIKLREGQKRYYAYRPVTDMDADHKRTLLAVSKQNEWSIDKLLVELLKEKKQPALF